jgi:hypothetical protein
VTDKLQSTLKLRWVLDARGYLLEVFIGHNTRSRTYAGRLTLSATDARAVRAVLLDYWGAVSDGSVHEQGWIEASTP